MTYNVGVLIADNQYVNLFLGLENKDAYIARIYSGNHVRHDNTVYLEPGI